MHKLLFVLISNSSRLRGTQNDAKGKIVRREKHEIVCVLFRVKANMVKMVM